MTVLIYEFYPYLIIGIPIAWALCYIIWERRARKQDTPRIENLATFGRALGGAFFCACLLVGYFIESQVVEAYDTSTCIRNLSTLSHAMLQYAHAHGDHLPQASEWATDIVPYLPPADRESAFHCPSSLTPYSYAFNNKLSGISLHSIRDPESTVMIYECNAYSKNANGDGSDLIVTRHRLARIMGRDYESFYFSYTACAGNHLVDVGTMSATAVFFDPKE